MPGEDHHERRDEWDGCGSQRGQTMAEYTVVAAISSSRASPRTPPSATLAALLQNAADVIGGLT